MIQAGARSVTEWRKKPAAVYTVMFITLVNGFM